MYFFSISVSLFCLFICLPLHFASTAYLCVFLFYFHQQTNDCRVAYAQTPENDRSWSCKTALRHTQRLAAQQVDSLVQVIDEDSQREIESAEIHIKFIWKEKLLHLVRVINLVKFDLSSIAEAEVYISIVIIQQKVNF